MATCKDCLHFDVCKYKDEKVSLGTKVEELVADKFTCFENRTNFAPIKRGKWRLNKDGSGTCSECGITSLAVWDYDNWQSFCGHCGADMRGV